MTGRPTLKEMAREAVLAHVGRATFAQIKAYALEHYDSVNPSALNCQVNSACVNVQARVNYLENQRRRVCHAGKSPDLFFKTARVEVQIYDPLKHGEREITEDSTAVGHAQWIVRPVSDKEAVPDSWK